jgi:ribokinase
VRFVGAVGEDDFGDQALAGLESEGVDVSDVQRLRGVPTGVALVMVDARGENLIAVASGANAELPANAVGRALRSIEWGFRVVCVLNLEIRDPPLLAAARAAAGGGARAILLNPAPAREIPSELFELHPILTPNAGELEFFGGDAAALSRRTAAPVVVTLGADGAMLVDGQKRRHFDAPAVEAVDTTGAGDAFNGTLAAALARGSSTEDAVGLAVAAASQSVTRHGAR